MQSKAITVSQVSWPAVAVQVLLYVLAIVFAVLAFGRNVNPVIAGAFPLLAYSVISKVVVARLHRTGIRLVKRGEWDEAIPFFQQSYEFFSRHPWVDRFRAVAILSPSRISYREMALANIAFCHGQAGRGLESRQGYERTLVEFPNSILAQSAIRMFDSMSRQADSA